MCLSRLCISHFTLPQTAVNKALKNMQNTPSPNTHADTIELIAMDPQFPF
jgi:hypothetical protein